MLDNQLIRLFLPLLKAGLSSPAYTSAPWSLPTIEVVQSNQPTQQGTNYTPTVYFFKVDAQPYGWVGRYDGYDEDTLAEQHTEIQYYTTVFQFAALVTQDPSNVHQITASDLVTACFQILQSDTVLSALTAAGVNILHVSEIRNPYFLNDNDRFTASPSFDITFTHKNVVTTTEPVITSPAVPDLYPI